MKTLTIHDLRSKVNILFHLVCMGTVKFMDKFPSIDFRTVYTTIRGSIREFEDRLKGFPWKPLCLDPETMMEYRLLKKKYYRYSVFLSTITSYPILSEVAGKDDISSSVFAKTALVTSIKTLDNINDQLHSTHEAIEAQKIYEAALLGKDYKYGIGNSNQEEYNFLAKAENFTYLMARWVFQTLSYTHYNSETWKYFVENTKEYIRGQIQSFRQRAETSGEMDISLSEFMRNVSSKAFGKPWIDIDFCFYEGAVGGLDRGERMAIESIERGLDLLFKSLLFYDDATDLKEDIKYRIINTVMLLGIELGKITEKDLWREGLYYKLYKRGSSKMPLGRGI